MVIIYDALVSISTHGISVDPGPPKNVDINNKGTHYDERKFARAFMASAHGFADLSYCVRRQVGCVLIAPSYDDTQHRIVSIGYNGTPPDDENVCETPGGKTKPDGIRAEMNAIKKLREEGGDMSGMILFITTAPCLPCATEIAAGKFAVVYYSDVYHTEAGLNHLRDCGIDVFQID